MTYAKRLDANSANFHEFKSLTLDLNHNISNLYCINVD